MPCVIQIEEFLNEQIYNAASPAINMSLPNAQSFIKSVNKKYGDEVARLIIGDTLDVTVYVPKALIDKYYASELDIELLEAERAEQEVRAAQKEDAERAGIAYDEDYLFNNEIDYEDYLENQFRAARDYDIAVKLGEKYKKAFGIDYQIITPADAALLLQLSPTPFSPGTSAFFYGNQVYFVQGNFNSNAVIHEFAHPLVKAIAFQNRKLFDNLYSQLSASVTGQEALAKVQAKYPELELDTDRFKEEAIVTAMELDAALKLENIKSSDTLFEKFMQNLMFAIKKVIQALTKKVNLKNLSASTTRDELVNMMVNEDFVIEDLNYQTTLFAEFRKDTDDFLSELKNVEPKKILNTINKFHTEMSFQLQELRNSPQKFKETLGKDAEQIIRKIRDYVNGYKTTDKNLTDSEIQELLEALMKDEADLNARSLSFINSLTELSLFADKIDVILQNMRRSKEYLTEEGNQKIQYFKQFMEREIQFLKDVNKELGLGPSNDLTKKIQSIRLQMENNSEAAKDMTFEYVKDLLLESGATMQENVKGYLVERIDKILKEDKFTDEEIEDFKQDLFDKLDVDNIRSISIKDFKLPREAPKAKYILDEIKEYNRNKVTEQAVDAYLRGHVQDLGLGGAMLNPIANVNDLFGAYTRYMKNKISDTEVKTQQKNMKFVEEITPMLNAVGWNPNNTTDLGSKLLFVDKKGIVNEQGDVEEYEAYAYLDKFKDWELDEARLKGALKKAQLKGDKDAIKAAMQAIRDFEKNFKVRRFADEVYEVQDIWLQDNTVYDPTTKTNITIPADVSLEAYNERNAALDDLSTYSSSSEFTTLDDLLEFTPSAAAKVRYNNLYNLYDNDGNYKQGIELQKVLVRRYYRQESKKFNESVSDIERFQKDYDHFINNELASLGITEDATPERFEAEIKKFMDKNTRIAYTDEYYQEKNEILDEINAINEKAKGADISKKLASLYEQRYNITNRVTDKDGEPNGTELGIESLQKLKEIEEEIVKLNDEFDKKTGLSKEDAYKLRYYEEKIIGAGKASSMSPEQKAEYQSLVSNKEAFGLSDYEITYLRSKFKKLAELTDNVATDYYIESFNTALGDLDVEPITMETADDWINSESILKARAENPRFSEWFDRNHYEKNVFNPELGFYESRFFRTKAWTVSKPSDAKYFKKTTIKDPVTGTERVIDGVPIAKYSYTKIKNKYKTGYNPKTDKVELEVGVHIDNRGNFLPKEYIPGNKSGALDNRYINQRYMDMKNAKSPEYLLLEAIKKQRLKTQEQSPYASRMYLDFPRFRIKDNLEYMQSGKLKQDAKDKGSAIKEGLKSAVTRAADDAARGEANFDPDYLYVPTDLQGKPLPKVPVSGLFKMPLNAVSQDVITSELNYMSSLDMQKTLIEAMPSAKALLDVLGDPDNALDRLDRASSKLSRAQDKTAVFLKRNTNNRLQFAEDYINRTFYGENVTQFQQENPIISKLVRKSMGAASFAFFAGNPVSTIKNKGGMTFQKLIYTSGGKFISYPAMALGQVQATKTIMEYAASGTYATGLKSLNMQLMDSFDMSPGKTKKDANRSHTNTAVKNLIDGAWMYSGRKLTEVQGALEIGFGLMAWQMVDQVQPDGSVTQIRYMDAFEIGPDGLAKVKDGINPEWGMNYTDHMVVAGDTLESIAKKYNMSVEELAKKNKMDAGSKLEEGTEIIISRNTKFNMMKLRMANVNKKLNGTIAALDSPTAEKSLLYDVASFSRKFGTGMFLSRFQMDTTKGNFGGKVWDWDLDEATRGKYVTFLQNSVKLIRDFKNYWPIMTKEEKSAVYEIVTEGMLIALSSLAIVFLFGFEGDDEDRFQKLKDREEKYGNAGWIANHMLYQIMMVQKENTSMTPLGVGEWLDFTKTSNIVMGPTLDLYLKIFKDLGYMITGNDKAIYKQEVGPYGWQEEGEYKLWNHLGGIFGLSGKNYSPYWAIKKNEIFTNLRG
jgi:hypothetical protein